MAIEPIGTMTAIQVQPAIKVQPVDTNKSGDGMDSVSTDSATPKTDEVTAAVAKATESDTQGEGGQQNSGNSSKQPDNEAIKKAVDELNKKMYNSEAVFGIHEGTNRVTIKLVDKNTKETIKELPPEKTLDMIARVWEMAGMLVDEKR